MKKQLIEENEEYDFNKNQSPRWGFYLVSEILNGRVAMIALPLIIIIELFSRKSLVYLMVTQFN
ncbi:unnamed protein product [Sphacelaria rigidula]